MQSSQFGVHEITDLREIINFKVACLAEAKSRLQKVGSADLKAIVEQSVQLGTNAVGEMKALLSKAATQMNE
ncbi:hypothetical protein [Niallia nealsonii]|uniref:Uncharacterized protein n=1 Tax=Niallia nealsonii TaxID=115979 RepID=A0A2N0YZH9_9BACI|nr:hypothetical protein [Niallia nealsonii]PKG22662.1 hypothetical protein CWS01_16165 [Niallia nealsonii]